MLAVSRTFSLIGVEAEPVHVELDVTRGLPAFTIVGLPDAAVRESRERVRAALVNSGFEFPLKRITANLAPADMRKAGPGFDLAIAAALMAASGQLPGAQLDPYAFAGELALDGSIRPVRGALAMARSARGWGMKGVVVAPQDAPVAALVGGIDVYALDHVAQLVQLGAGQVEPATPAPPAQRQDQLPDLADLCGQPALRRALELAAAGAHSMLLTGAPGGGKTLAARRLPSLLPPLVGDELVEVARIAGICGASVNDPLPARPFRSPHHSSSAIALIGGGTPPRPGEVTRAHRGVLFLDELGEFRREALEALRQPLEEGQVTISRAGRSVTMPCRFTLLAASNPCPCGRGEDSGDCSCDPRAAARYRAKLSGALADRIDLSISVGRPSAEALAGEPGESSAAVRERVLAARAIQEERLGPGRANADMSSLETRVHCGLDPAAAALLAEGHTRLGLSARGRDRAIRVARTLADLDGVAALSADHVAEALSFRRRRAG